MGHREVDERVSAERLRDFSRKVLDDLAALSMMLEKGLFETGVRRIGAEQEIVLIDAAGQPASVGTAVLDAVDDPHLTTELGRFNLELNLDPLRFEGRCFSTLQEMLERLLDRVRSAARDEGADVLLTGILPTLRVSHLDLEHMTPIARYRALDDAMRRLRGGRPCELHIRGRDELRLAHDNVMFEACNTSFQVHLQVDPDEFASLYNIAQVVAAPVLAVAANSPLLLGRQLWRETRIALFEQSIDTRPRTAHLREATRRVSFGRRWLDDSVVEIFEEDISRFSALLATEVEEDPFRKLENGEAPALRALALHNGTVYRWNRPCYGVSNGRPHLRIENRVLPSGPTVLDEVANAAFWLGLVVGMGDTVSDVRRELEFSSVRENFVAAARHGLGARLHWTGERQFSVPELVTEELLPLARHGLDRMEVAAEDSERLLGVIAGRCESGRGGARWILASYDRLRRQAKDGVALAGVVRGALSRQSSGRPVHEWSLADAEELRGAEDETPRRVEQVMSTDLFTVHDEESVDIVASVMKWRHIRRVPVEDGMGRLVGLVTYRSLLEVMSEGRHATGPVPVREIMQTDLTTVTPSTSTLLAARLMRERRIGCLPVVDRDRSLVGILTEHDLMELAWPALEAQLESAIAKRDSAAGAAPPAPSKG